MYVLMIHIYDYCTLVLQFADRTVAMSAIDMTSLLLEVSAPMKQLYPSMPSKVLEALCYAIAGATIPHSRNVCMLPAVAMQCSRICVFCACVCTHWTHYCMLLK